MEAHDVLEITPINRGIYKQLAGLSSNTTPAYIVAALVALYFWYLVVLSVYRLFFSPIAHFPGPTIAAATDWYEFYYNVVKDGQYGEKVKGMHQKYGPIVRINPWELSIRDPDFYSVLYVSGSTRRTNMWARGREGNGFSNTHHLTVPHDIHRQKRKHLESYFSRKNVTAMEDLIARKSSLLGERLSSLRGSKSVLNLHCVFMALTGDVIGHVSSGADPELLQDANFSPQWHELMTKTVLMAPLFKAFPWLNRLIQLLPESTMAKLYPAGISNKIVGKMGREYIDDIRKDIEKANAGLSEGGQSLFHHFLANETQESERSSARLQAECLLFLVAGTFSSAHTLALIAYSVIANPKIYERLSQELEGPMATYPEHVPRWANLEKIPYLQGCIKEGLRLSGLVGNLLRCSPDVDLPYKNWIIPKNTPVGMSIYEMHTDPNVFPEPYMFMPERWLGEVDPNMARNFVPFTKGSRSCLGTNLAMVELYATIAILFQPGAPKLSLFETDHTDVFPVRDYTIGLPKSESQGVRVLVN